LRILFLLTQDLHSPSGLGRYWPLARELTQLGQHVSIAALHPDFTNLQCKQDTIEGVSVNYVAPMHVMKSESKKEYYKPGRLLQIATWATLNLAKASLNTQADLIIVGKPHPMNSLAAISGKVFRGQHIYLDCDDFEAASGRFSSNIQSKIITSFEKWMPRRVRAISTNTYFMQKKLISWGIPTERIHYLPNGVDRDRFSRANYDQIARLKSELVISDRPVVAYIGSLSLPSHPVDLLLEAFAVLIQSHPDAVLLLVGGGEDLITLMDLAQRLGIEKSVRFTGRVAPEQVPTYYLLANVSVDPVYDNDAARGRCPLKLFESWACNVPFVTADVGDRRLLLEGSQVESAAGILVKPGDLHSLASGIHQILTEPGLTKTIVATGQLRIKDYYWDILASKLLNFYSRYE
jgi:glycosyltransferase involved in cell wall biosynthesis